MANTTNYNWETPDDTDLVKDGAAAIRTLGNSIDTTTKNLNPETTTGDIAYRSATANTNTRLAIGTTGQVLTVAAGVPSWATPTDQTPLTTKGDVFTFSTVDARLGVGANGTVLTADSAETTGLKWAAPAAASFVGCSVYNSASQSIATNTATILTFNSEHFDSDSLHSTSTNTGRITIPAGKGGKYLVIGTTYVQADNNGTQRILRIFKNGGSGTGTRLTNQHIPPDTDVTTIITTGIFNVVAGDYFQLEAYQDSGGPLSFFATDEFGFFQAVYLGA